METNSKKGKLEKKKRKDPLTFIHDLKEELKKVSWTTKADLLSATKVVIIATFCFGIGIYVSDLVIKGILEGVKRALLWILG